MKFTTSTFCLLASAAFAFSPAAAHDFVLTPGMDEEDKISVRGLYGHPGAWDRPDLRRLVALDVYPPGSDESSSILESAEPANASNLQIAASGERPESAGDGTVIVAAAYDNGYWVSTEDGTYYNTSKQMAPEHIEVSGSSHSIKFSKLLLGEGEGFRTMVGQRLEIVPVAAPASVESGSELPVQVLFDGEPLPDAEAGLYAIDGVMNEDEELPTTDEEGMIRLATGEPGVKLIRVNHEVEGGEPSELADGQIFSATLIFKTK